MTSEKRILHTDFDGGKSWQGNNCMGNIISYAEKNIDYGV